MSTRSLAIEGEARPAASSARPVPAWLYWLGLALAVIGFGPLGFNPGSASADAWRALLVNFLYWTSLSFGLVAWAVIFRLARATWSAPFNRIAHAAVAFLPFCLLDFVILYFGRTYFLPWIKGGAGDRSIWLNEPFLFARNGIGLLVLYLLAFAFVRTYLRADARQAEGLDEAEIARYSRRLSILGVSYGIVFAVVFTLLAFDFVMSLLPRWYSALLGVYFFAGALYLSMAVLILLAVATRRWLGNEQQLGRKRFLDVGNLLMAFGMFLTYTFYSQLLPIWYENLPAETSYLIPRLNTQHWRVLGWVLLGTCYLGPFAILFIREMKESWRTLTAVALLVVVAMGLERYLLVTPSLAPRPTFPLLEILIFLGFLGVFLLTTVSFLARHPAVSELDLALVKEHEDWL